MCILVADAPAPAALRDISGEAAFLETNARPAIGTAIELHHPEAGLIEGWVRSLSADGVEIAFEHGEASVAFAMAAIVADMSRPL